MTMIAVAFIGILVLAITIQQNRKISKKSKVVDVLSKRVYVLAERTQDLRKDITELKDQHRIDIETIMNRHSSEIKELKDNVSRLTTRIEVTEKLLQQRVQPFHLRAVK